MDSSGTAARCRYEVHLCSNLCERSGLERRGRCAGTARSSSVCPTRQRAPSEPKDFFLAHNERLVMRSKYLIYKL